MNIFKAYDIRGVYPEEIAEDIVYRIGCATVRFLGAKSIAVGRDIRQSSPSLFNALAKGISDEGCEVVDLGLATTPMVYFASSRLDVDGAISLTASHNPAEYNGLKLCRKGAVPIGENSGLKEIEAIAMTEIPERKSGKLNIREHDIKEEYIDYFASFAKFGDTKFKIAVDPANAMGILEMDIYRRFPKNIEIHAIYDDLDPMFPNHEANPLKLETLADLQKKVKEIGANIGIANDGDADRIAFVDERGEIIPMDLATALLSSIVLKQHPGATILYDLRSSKAVREIIEENGGTAKECRVGHALIKKQMRDDGALFAGELSGHYYFRENSFAEAGTFAAILILNLMAETGKPVSELVKNARRYFHSGEINSEVEDKEAVLRTLREKYADGKQHELDGLKVEYPDWWFNVRPSNTEPVLRLNLEADTSEKMERRRDEILTIIRGA